MMSTHRRSIPAAVAVAIVAAVAIPALTGAQTSTGKTQTLRFFDKPVAITLTHPNGKIIRRGPHPQPKPGDILDVYSLDYAGNHLHHASNWTMSGHLRCTFGNGAPVCESHTALGSSILIFDGNKLAAGTGLYQGATGRVISNMEVGNGNDSDVVARIQRRR
jgi:hypothetical protein